MSDEYDSEAEAFSGGSHRYQSDPRQGPRHEDDYDPQGQYAYPPSARFANDIPRNVPPHSTAPWELSGHVRSQEGSNYTHSSSWPNNQMYGRGYAPEYAGQTFDGRQEPVYEDQYNGQEEALRYDAHESYQHESYQPQSSRPHVNGFPGYGPPMVHPGPRHASYPEEEATEPPLGHPVTLPSDRVLDRRYMRQSPYYFREGKVFSILWHENDGRGVANETLVSRGPQYRGRFGEPIYSTIRRMVVIKQFDQCSWCFALLSAITTYGGRGVAKRGVDPEKHAIVYMRSTNPEMGRREPNMSKEPLEVAPENPDERLDPMSRLNFGKIYTVEHNVKVLPIGRITSGSMTRFRHYARDELAL
ncbi:uncharacterized protein DSM5745_06753 [Aspergillus mulundensis]|uniref:DUF6590 domain-containing protein n=1 Tax=Aspergillus mulundensis TaxID=1810919 RepID=A0A3D8RSG9_9EURO|nr:hypothetical protein DSM5745_06753 [Aspergillus mulundensis]RDW76761.1 hypothetical protein DSM5745_06753 [Aspergillus mulundensis]